MSAESEKKTKHFTTLFKAEASLFQVVSHEWERVWGEVVLSMKEAKQQRTYLRWTNADGLMMYDHAHGVMLQGDELPEDIRDQLHSTPLQLLQWYVGGHTSGDPDGFYRPSVLHLEDIHPYLEMEPTKHEERDELMWWLRQAARMNAADEDIRTRTVIIGTTQEMYLQELEKELPTIQLPLPDIRTLRQVRGSVVERFSLTGEQWSDSERVVQAALGLSYMEAELAFSKAVAERNKLTDDEIDIINAEKKQIISRNGILEFYEVDELPEVCGLSGMQKWFKQRRHTFDPQAKKDGVDFPKGALLLGIPGCGKSLTAKATGKWWGFPLLRFDLGRVFGGIQGESEKNIRSALQIAEAVSPCILWLDEIEKGMQGSESSGQTDGGTTARVLGTFLTWMQEKTKPVFVMATANNVDQLPPEMLRKGRFDEIFFVDLPTESVRHEIFKYFIGVHDKKNPKVNSNNFNIEELAALTVGFSGAEIEQAVKDAVFAGYDEDRDVSQSDIIQAVDSTYPLSRTRAEEITKMRKWARHRCRIAADEDAEELPKNWDKDKVPKLKSERRNMFLDIQE